MVHDTSSYFECPIMVDSGAFSAWTKGVDLDVVEYGKFLQNNLDEIAIYVNMDVIPLNSTVEMVELSAKGSWENLKILEGMGLSPMPVFHRGENMHWLEKYIQDYDYIGLGGVAKSGFKEKNEWLDSVMPLLTDSSGKAICKIHGFGVTSFELLVVYPWYSVDSTSWIQGAGYGKIFVPTFVDGVPVYNKPMALLVTSNVKKGRGNFLSSLGPIQMKYVISWLESFGVDVTKLPDSRDERSAVNLKFFTEMAKVKTKPWIRKRGIFDD